VGDGKGLAFSDSLPRNRESVNGCGRGSRSCWRFRPIEGGWFIFEQHES
jgi:hypothetical protein